MVEVLAKWRNTRGGDVLILRSCIIILLTDIHDCNSWCCTSVGFPLGNIYIFFYHVGFLSTVPSVYRGAQCATLPSLDNILSKVGTYNE